MSVRNLMQKDVSENESSGDEEYEVNEILEMRVLEDGTEEFKVRWKNYGSSDDSWEPRANLEGAKTALNKFLKAKNPGKKTSKTSGTPSKGRKRKVGGNGQDAEDGANIRSSSGSESDDDDFSVSSASKKKKPPGKKSKKASIGRMVTSAGRTISSSASRPTPHNGDSLTMAINRRMNLGQHSSWLDSGSESDSNSTTARKKGTTEGGKGGTAAKGAEMEKAKGRAENGITMSSSGVADNDNVGNISDDSATTEKLANSPSPHFDNEAKGDEDEPLNMRSEHDPTPANLSSGMNGSVSKLGSKESSTSVEYVSRKSSSKLKAQVARSLMGTSSKRTEQTPKTSKTKEAPLQFDGIYFNSKGLQIVVQGSQDKNNARRVLTFEEAKDEDAIGLCDYLRGMVKFTEEGKARISVPHNMETDERDGKESRMRDDGKLNFDE